MTPTDPRPSAPATLTEIAYLLAWCRRLTTTHPEQRDPDEQAAYQAAKADLLTRIAAANDTRDPGLAARAHQAATDVTADARPGHQEQS
ncbi:hypothetical protein Acor_40750 [Acrocarpospora corrugata]|uniref:Uncharacterized protein n=1 Tax=Acrocarpospora corrugata TaxID=35763 RepID=A0A5M3W1A5_9ACTN|nr:hypothetical protein [Acrocarpospora corrugata]GES02010.1 hypothetical protein Acor_40750 [Acrocarpospora corrugata]